MVHEAGEPTNAPIFDLCAVNNRRERQTAPFRNVELPGRLASGRESLADLSPLGSVERSNRLDR